MKIADNGACVRVIVLQCTPAIVAVGRAVAAAGTEPQTVTNQALCAGSFTREMRALSVTINFGASGTLCRQLHAGDACAISDHLLRHRERAVAVRQHPPRHRHAAGERMLCYDVHALLRQCQLPVATATCLKAH